MWRQCVLLSVVFAWQVSISTSELINLIEPQVDHRAPRSDLIRINANHWQRNDDDWNMMDRNNETFQTTAVVKVMFQQAIPATRIRITLAPGWREESRLPLRWQVGDSPDWTVVDEPAIVDGVIEFDLEYELDFDREDEVTSFRIETYGKLRRSGRRGRSYVSIAEIELLGSREALDTMWPYGAYPCSQRLEMITPLRGPKGRLFAKANNAVSKSELRRVFTSDWAAKQNLPSFEYRGADPVVIGVKFKEIPTVHAITVHGWQFYYRSHIERMVLQGHDCQPSCSKAGPKGWVTLVDRKLEERATKEQHKVAPDPFYLATPGEYKAYRIKFYPRPKPILNPMDIDSIFFLGCKAD